MKIVISIVLILQVVVSFSQDEMYDICPIKNSEEVPTATIYNDKGDSLDLKEYVADRPVIIVFYRGGWCPYCTEHLSALNLIANEIDSLGFELMAITPDDFTKLDSSYKRSGELDYKLFSDKELDAINAFGIGWEINEELYEKYKNKYGMDVEWWSGAKHHVLPVPSVFVIDQGKIQYQHVDPNYRARLDPEILLSYLTASIKNREE